VLDAVASRLLREGRLHENARFGARVLGAGQRPAAVERPPVSSLRAAA
jgi:hypothetical protein